MNSSDSMYHQQRPAQIYSMGTTTTDAAAATTEQQSIALVPTLTHENALLFFAAAAAAAATSSSTSSSSTKVDKKVESRCVGQSRFAVLQPTTTAIVPQTNDISYLMSQQQSLMISEKIVAEDRPNWQFEKQQHDTFCQTSTTQRSTVAIQNQKLSYKAAKFRSALAGQTSRRDSLRLQQLQVKPKKKSTYKHVPHSEKPYHVVARRNARERRRVQAVNAAFVELRKRVPVPMRGKRVSKAKTLHLAIDYIHYLQKVLHGTGDSAEEQQNMRSDKTEISTMGFQAQLPATSTQQHKLNMSKSLSYTRRGRAQRLGSLGAQQTFAQRRHANTTKSGRQRQHPMVSVESLNFLRQPQPNSLPSNQWNVFMQQQSRNFVVTKGESQFDANAQLPIAFECSKSSTLPIAFTSSNTAGLVSAPQIQESAVNRGWQVTDF